MKKILPIWVIGVLLLSGFGAVALNSDVKELDFQTIDFENTGGGSRDYTHTVLVEVGTSQSCSACPASNLAWHSIYGGGNYNFEYGEFVTQNPKASQYMHSHYNLYWVPTSYFDGGQFVHPGTNTNTFTSYLDTCGLRSVPDLDASLNALWLGNGKIDISLSIENNDNNDYPGTLRVYVIELVSTIWTDFNGNPYYHAFLDFVWDQSIDIDAGDAFEDNKIWDGAAAGYPNIEQDNLQVILAVFDDEPHQAYSKPPNGNPFWAYYVDETIAAFGAIKGKLASGEYKKADVAMAFGE